MLASPPGPPDDIERDHEMRSHVIVITQIDWDGNGHERVFTQHATDRDLDRRLHNIAYAFNLDHTRVEVDGVTVSLARD